MATENSNANPCTCSGMQLFSAALDPKDLKKSGTTALARNLPSDPTAIANQINGVRDSSAKNAQTARQRLCFAFERIDMRLKKGASPKTVSSNIKTLMHEYEESGTIGNSEPANAKKRRNRRSRLR